MNALKAVAFASELPWFKNHLVEQNMTSGTFQLRRPFNLALAFTCAFVCLACVGTTNAQSFVANLDASQVNGSSTETGTAVASFYLDSAQQNLSYSIQIFGLDLKPVPADRTGFSDVTAIHLHNGFVDTSGPHVLNIFGIPSEDDAEMVVDFANDTISGVFNDADAIDPNTGGLFDQNNPINTKLLSNFTDDLIDQQLYLAIHTAGQNGNIAIRGQLIAVPEPSSLAIIAFGGLCVFSRRRQRD
jgi:hypothetical protein